MPRTMLNISGPTLGSARWAGDYMDRDHLVPGGAKLDATQFISALTGTRVVVGAAGAAAAAVAVPVAALANAIPVNTVLDFGGAKFARLTAAAAKGAVTLTTAPLVTALVSGDTATYAGTGKKNIPSGTLLGRTRAERDAGTPFGVPIDTDEEIFLLAFDITDADANDDCELYRYNSIVYENFLPDFAAASATIKAFIRSRYVASIGQV
jgi:hypothetical protein